MAGAIIRRAGRTTAEGANTNACDRTPAQEPPFWWDAYLVVPHWVEDEINDAAEAADEGPGGDFAFREALWAVHDTYEAHEIEAVRQRDLWFERETEAMCEGVSRVRAA